MPHQIPIGLGSRADPRTPSIEDAIVMIAFVIVAVALAFVVLSRGFSTTHKAKTAMISPSLWNSLPLPTLIGIMVTLGTPLVIHPTR